MNFSEQIKKAKEDKKPAFFKSLFKNLPNWESFIGMMDYSFNHSVSEIPLNHDNRFLINDKNVKFPNTGISVHPNASYVNYWSLTEKSLDLFPGHKDICKFINDNMNLGVGGEKSIINFVGNPQEFSIHKDHNDVFSLHSVGKMYYRIYEGLTEEEEHQTSLPNREYTEYLFEPGDAMYIPEGVFHQVVVTEPRATLIFGCHIIGGE